jgi:hypothetical protein
MHHHTCTFAVVVAHSVFMMMLMQCLILIQSYMVHVYYTDCSVQQFTAYYTAAFVSIV